MTYDVATDTAEGRHHLQRVAKACQAFSERVQKSVFECTLMQAQLTQVASRLRLEVDVTTDSLRIYRLREPRLNYLEVIGVVPVLDLHNPLSIVTRGPTALPPKAEGYGQVEQPLHKWSGLSAAASTGYLSVKQARNCTKAQGVYGKEEIYTVQMPSHPASVLGED